MKKHSPALFIALVVAAVGSSCASNSTPADSTSTDSSAVPSTLSAVRSVSLALTVGTVDEPAINTSTLLIGEDGTVSGTGYLADAGRAAAGAALLDNPAVLKRLIDGPRPNVECTMMYGGPDEATITGTLRGSIVNQSFNRADGCGIADWELLTPILGRSHWDGQYRIYRRDEGPISVKVGSGFTIELDSNATTGYQWQVLPLEHALTASGHHYVNPTDGAVGTGGREQFQFRAELAGTVSVTLEFRRPFEPASTPAVDTVTFAVTVTP